MPDFFINPRVIPLARREGTLIVHPHAQRTGGNTIRSALLGKSLGQDRVYNLKAVPGAKDWEQLTDKDVEGFRAFTAHFNFVPNQLRRACVPITMIRHPLYRAASLYGFARSKKDYRFHKIAMSNDMAGWYRLASDEFPAYFRNLQCRRICGYDDAWVTLERIRTKYLGVGFTDHAGEFAAALCDAMGWPNSRIVSKGTDAERYANVITPEFRDMVLAENAEDLALFEAMAKGPPYRLMPLFSLRQARRIIEHTRRTFYHWRKKSPKTVPV